MRAGILEARAHGVERHMGRAQLMPPELHGPVPVIGGLLAIDDAALDPDGFRVAAGLAGIVPHPFDQGLRLVVTARPARGEERVQARELGIPAVADGADSRDHLLRHPSEPDRDRALHRQRVDARVGHGMEAALEADERLRPQLPQQAHLLFEAGAAILERHAQRLVLHPVPARADAEAHAPAGEHVDLRRLLGDQGGLALGEDQDRGAELEPLADRRDVAEQDEGLVEHVDLAVGALQALEVVGSGIGAENVIEGQEMIEAHLLHRLDVVADADRIGADLGLRENDAEFHGGSLAIVLSPIPRPAATRIPGSTLARASTAIEPASRRLRPRPVPSLSSVPGSAYDSPPPHPRPVWEWRSGPGPRGARGARLGGTPAAMVAV